MTKWDNLCKRNYDLHQTENDKYRLSEFVTIHLENNVGPDPHSLTAL